jgi:hypothetical protein
LTKVVTDVARTDYHRRRIPRDLQGIVIEGFRLTPVFNVPLRNGMTRAKAVAFTEDLIEKARARANYRLTDENAWELATAICDAHEALLREGLSELDKLEVGGLHAGKSLSLRMELAGHSTGSGVHQTYIYAGSSLKSLKAEIDKVKYPIRIPR